jgi:hypothetical protein
MTARSRLWFAVFLLLVFVTGGLSGVVLDRLWLVGRGRAVWGGERLADGPGPGFPGRRGSGPGPVAIDGQIARLNRQLDLTDAQRVQLRDILRRWNARAATLRGEARRQYVEAQTALRADIEAILSDEQRALFRSQVLR